MRRESECSNVYNSQTKRARLQSILEAMERYAKAGRAVKVEWVQELSDLLIDAELFSAPEFKRGVSVCSLCREVIDENVFVSMGEPGLYAHRYCYYFPASGAVSAPEADSNKTLGSEIPAPTDPVQESGAGSSITTTQACSNKKGS